MPAGRRVARGSQVYLAGYRIQAGSLGCRENLPEACVGNPQGIRKARAIFNPSFSGCREKMTLQNDCMGKSSYAFGVIRKENASVTCHTAERKLARVGRGRLQEVGVEQSLK